MKQWYALYVSLYSFDLLYSLRIASKYFKNDRGCFRVLKYTRSSTHANSQSDNGNWKCNHFKSFFLLSLY